MGDKKSAAKADDEAKMQADGEDDDWEDEAEWTDGEEGEEGRNSKDRYARADSFQIRLQPFRACLHCCTTFNRSDMSALVLAKKFFCIEFMICAETHSPMGGLQ
jgi:hypothetical protein